MNYYLMNKNQKLLEFYVENQPLGEQVKEVRSFSDIRPIGFSDIATWVNTRNYAKHKDYLREWAKSLGMDTVTGFLDISLALGINDSLWVKRTDSDSRWENVNLYQNQFSDVAEKTAFEAGLPGLNLSTTDIKSPEFTSEGSSPKCWKKENDTIYLYKTGWAKEVLPDEPHGREPYSEFMASQIAKEIVGEKAIPYDLVMFKNRLCTKCALFTDENTGYVPLSKFLDLRRNYTLNDIINVGTDKGYEREFKEMFFIDSIVFNQDRHLGNFGFLVDNDTFQIKRFVPLFDFNLSMLCRTRDSYLNNFDSYRTSFAISHYLGGDFIEIGKALLDSDTKDMLPKEFVFPRHPLYNLPENRLQNLNDILNQTLNEITGRKLYPIPFAEISVDLPGKQGSEHEESDEKYDDYDPRTDD